MKNLKLILGLLALAAVAMPAAAQTGRADRKFKIGTDVNGNLSDSLDMLGVAVDTASASGTVTPNQGSGVARTTARLWFAGSGKLYDVAVASGAATEMVFCYDSATASEVNYETTTISLVALVQRIATKVAHAWDSGRPVPIRIRSGLVCDSTDNNPYFPIFEKE